ncbi:hypothetical protein [Streptomyces sp. FIT100]|uniref:hypothetical protein n=1 Tax=Streptomyces sp. FIT100 TaxID=2837956 RepID=UPI0021C96FB7|nr:hypothetical protein [Streptomyces sp. FIT100]UUN25530.1 hypothetical protein KK483_03180 [Streptomyces sp. FIT100]
MSANHKSSAGYLEAHRGNPEQRAADRELYEQLVTDGFTGPRFELLREDLWLYGWRVLRRWMREGEIIARCRESDIYFFAPYTEVEEMMRRDEVRVDIAGLCLGKAVPLFMRLLSQGRWNPEGGASIRTFFIGLCLACFRDAYREWAGPYRRRLAEVLHPDVIGGFPKVSLAPEPAAQMLFRDTIDTILADASWEERAVCMLMLTTGATQEQIAQRLGTTRKAVERRLGRIRRRAQELAAAGVIMVPSVSSAVAK